MEFYPDNISDANKAEKAVWQQVKFAFRDDIGVAFHRYQLFDRYGNLEREIDILIIHRQLGLWVIECKGCYVNNIESINGAEWRMKNWHKDREKPVIQAQDQMFAIKRKLSKDFCNLLTFNFRVALPLINRKEWENQGFSNFLNTQGSVLIAEDLEPDILKHKLHEGAGSRQRSLTEEKWQSLMCILGGSNQKPVDKPPSPTLKDIVGKTEELYKTDDSLTPRAVFTNVQLPVNLVDKKSESQLNLETSHQRKIELEELLIEDEEELHRLDSGEEDECLEFPPDEEDGESAKDGKVEWTQTQKKHYTEDSIRLYLQEIGRIRLLRADEEIELARKIADLLELERVHEKLSQQLARHPQDSEWAEAVQLPLSQFRYRLHVGRRAKDKMVQSNLRLVVSIAKKYMNHGLSFQDLIQEGSLGLIRAAEKFDHEKGYKFTTYATWWIRQAITRAIVDQSRTIRLPVHLYETISRIKKTTKLLSQKIGRKPTGVEIATHMQMTIEKLQFIAKLAQLPISLETPLYVRVEKDPWSNQEDIQEYLCLGDFIEAIEETPEERVSKNLLREDLEKVLDSLSPRERDVLRLRYGLDDGSMKTLEEIGQIFNVTRERIRQIEAKALRKLRHPNRNSFLKEYIRGCQPYDSQQKKYEEQSVANQDYNQKTKNATNCVQKGLTCHRLGDFLGAIENFTQALKLDPNNAQLYYHRGQALAKRKFHKGAIEDFTQAINLDPQYIDAYYQRGHVCYSLGDSQKAIEDYSQVLSLNSNEALAYFYRGFVRSTLGQMQGAIGNYNQALKIKPDLAEAYFHRGVALHHLGDLYRAIEDYNQALQIHPALTEAYSRRGLARHSLRNYQGALEDYSQVVQINSEDAMTYYYRGLVYENLSDYVKALLDFNKVLEINPSFVKAYYNRGSVHYNLGNYQKALEDLDRLLRIKPNDVQAYNKRSSIRAVLRDYQGAMEDLQNASKY